MGVSQELTLIVVNFKKGTPFLQTNALILSPVETLNSVSCDGLGIYPIQLEMRVTTHATLNI